MNNLNNKHRFLLWSISGLATLIGDAQPVMAVPCGVEEVLTYVGQNTYNYPATGAAKGVYELLLYPTSYPIRPGATVDNTGAVPTSITNMPTFSSRRFKGPNGPTAVAGYISADDYYSWPSLQTAINASKVLPSKKFACTGTLTERLSDISGFFAHIGNEVGGSSPTQPPSTTGIAWGMSKYAEDGSWGECPASTPGKKTLLVAGIRADGTAVIDPATYNGKAGGQMYMCGYQDPTKPVSFDASNPNQPVYVLSNDDSTTQTGSRAPQYGIYYGRGPKQLTYDYNYRWAGNVRDPQSPDDLANDPDQLLINSSIGWETAFAYQVVNYTQAGSSYTKPSMETAQISSLWSAYKKANPATVPDARGEWGFGQTINIINGGVECLSSSNHQTLTRINNYIELMIRLGADVKQLTVGQADGSVTTLSKGDLEANIYDRNVSYSWGSPKERAWSTGPMPTSYYTTYPPGPYRLQYTDPDKSNSLIDERLDCVNYQTWNK